MNIVIVGAGEIGWFLASVLSREQHNVIVLDKDPVILQKLSAQIDVATRVGGATDWQVLDDLLEWLPDLLIALTDNDETNLVSCALAKNLGYPMSIARVRDNKFLNRTRLDFARIFDIDHFICPEILVANDILEYMMSQKSLAIEHFAHGAVELRTIVIPPYWNKPHLALSDLNLPPNILAGLIRRIKTGGKLGNTLEDQIIFPHGHDVILPGDEVTFIGETDAMTHLQSFFNLTTTNIESVVIVGGTYTSLHLAKLLEKRKIGVRILEKNFDVCTRLAEQLPNTTIIHHDATDKGFLQSEKVDQADLFVACTRHDDVNILCCLLAKDIGCKDVLMILSNVDYTPMLEQIGIKHVVSPRVVTATRILSQILTGTVTSLISMYDNRAEILEVNVSTHSKVIGIPLSELGPLLPNDFLIAMIQNRGRIMVAHGNRVISIGDTVIVVTDPRHIPELEKIF